MKIITLQAENIKKLVVIEIKPDGNMVEITGKNGQGKTSVLDCIWWALAGTSNIQNAPIRKGQTEARIRLDLGDIIVTRTFKAKDDGATSSITVENSKGARFPSPQAMLDELLGQLSFDPLAFSRMPAKEQFNTLRQFVPGVDFNAIDIKNQSDYNLRTELNRQARVAKAAADSIVVPEGTPSDIKKVDDSALIKKVEEAGKHNAEIETRKSNRADFQNQIERKKDSLTAIASQIVEAKKRLGDLEAAQHDEYTLLESMEKKLSGAPPLPEPIDTGALMTQITTAKATNEIVARMEQKNGFLLSMRQFETESQEITDRMEKRNADKVKAIASAKLPVKGIGFGEDMILLNDIPFDQASDAEQLRASIAIAMALNPKLKVIRVRDGSLLDKNSMKILAQMAEENDTQVWIERVDGSGKVGFVLEDGHVKAAK